MKRFRTGFSLMEIVISLGVMSILVGTAAPLANNVNRTLEIQSSISEMKNIETALVTYFRDTGTFPVEAQGLTALQQIPNPNPAVWNGPYLSGALTSITTDSWSAPYQYATFQNCPQDCSPAGCKIAPNNCTALTTVSAGLYDLRVTQTAKLFSPGRNTADETSLVACATTAPCGDDLFLNISSVNTARGIQTDTLERLGSIMEVVQQVRMTNPNLFTELDAKRAGGNCTISNLAINEVNVQSGGALGFFHGQDQWGNWFQWSEGARQFYSVGPDRTDNTCGDDGGISVSDIAGSF
ncbi:MAG: type II secretion system protein GspG [SAR324 cluster bacterium]|nr:type II secretion system protein GspG [SAR324 cluster bacterium]